MSINRNRKKKNITIFFIIYIILHFYKFIKPFKIIKIKVFYLFLLKLCNEREQKNALKIENKLYNIEDFGATLRNKFGADNNISNIMLAEIFLAKYPMYSCKIKKSSDYVNKKNCGCC